MICLQGGITSRRAVIFGAALATMPSVSRADGTAEAPAKGSKAEKLAKQMAVVNFTVGFLHVLGVVSLPCSAFPHRRFHHSLLRTVTESSRPFERDGEARSRDGWKTYLSFDLFGGSLGKGGRERGRDRRSVLATLSRMHPPPPSHCIACYPTLYDSDLWPRIACRKGSTRRQKRPSSSPRRGTSRSVIFCTAE